MSAQIIWLPKGPRAYANRYRRKSVTVPDHHAGCGCDLCRKPIPDPLPLDPLDVIDKDERYREDRREWRELNGLPLPKARGPRSL